VPRLRITPAGKADLADIWEYIAEDSVGSADAFVDRLSETIQVLGHHPGIGRHRPEIAPGMPSFPFEPYVIFYRTRHRVVEIVRVLHAARDIHRIFGA
jgi:toxin ParE1/3/4